MTETILVTDASVPLEVKSQNSFRETQQMLESYILPLINDRYIDRLDSRIDRRSNIFFPVSNAKLRKLSDSDKTNNLLYFNEFECQDKEYQQPSIPITIAVDQVSPTPSPRLQEQQHKGFNCFYCSQDYSSDKSVLNI
jgi:hypothetical protein